MRIVYLASSGIVPWSSLEGIADPDFGTIVVVADSKLRLVWGMVSVLALLRRSSTKIFRWHTIGRPFVGNKVQLMKLKKELGSDLPGFKNTHFEQSEKSGIWCDSSELVDPLSPNHFDYLVGGKRTLLILAPPSIQDTKDACRILCCYPAGYGPQELLILLKNYRDIIAIRFYEEETHVAADLFGRREIIEQLTKDLAAANTDMVSVNTREKIVDLINAARKTL